MKVINKTHFKFLSLGILGLIFVTNVSASDDSSKQNSRFPKVRHPNPSQFDPFQGMTKEEIEIVDSLIHSSDPVLRLEAASRLGGRIAYGEQPNPRFVDPLVAALWDKDYRVRAKAALSLGNIGDSRLTAVSALSRLLKNGSEHWEVRINAALALGMIGERDPGAIASLKAGLRDENWRVQRASKTALKKIEKLHELSDLESELWTGQIPDINPNLPEKLLISASFSQDGSKVLTVSQRTFFGSSRNGSLPREEMRWSLYREGMSCGWVLNLRTGEQQEIPAWARDSRSHAALPFSPDGSKVLTGPREKCGWLPLPLPPTRKSTILDLETGDEKSILDDGDTFSMAWFSPDGSKVLGKGDKVVRILDLETGEEKVVEAYGPKLLHEFSPDSSKVFIEDRFNLGGKILDLVTGEEKTILASRQIKSARFSSDGLRLATVDNILHGVDHAASIFDLVTGKEKKIKLDTDLERASFSSDLSKVITVTQDDQVKIIDLATGEEKSIPNGGGIDFVAFSPDDLKVVITAYDYPIRVGTATILDLQTGEEKTVKHRGPVPHASFSSDGTKIVTASWDGTSKILDFVTGETKTLDQIGKELLNVNTQDKSFLSSVPEGISEIQHTAIDHVKEREKNRESKNFRD